jgi:nitrogen fixation protein NifX
MTGDLPPMIRVAFASNDRTHVNLHFGAADSFVIYDVVAGEADLVAIGNFSQVEMKGENKDKGKPREAVVAALASQASEEMSVPSSVVVEDVALVPDDKVIAKLDFIEGCAAVYAASIGSSSIKRLMARQIQPIVVDNGHEIEDLLNEVSLALCYGGLSWVDRAKGKPRSPGRFDNKLRDSGGARRRLISSIEELEETP